jgi:hypothetical protein
MKRDQKELVHYKVSYPGVAPHNSAGCGVRWHKKKLFKKPEVTTYKSQNYSTLNLKLFIPRILMKLKTHVTPKNAPFYNLGVISSSLFLHDSALLSHRLQGADTDIYFKHTAIEVTITVHMPCYQYCRNLHIRWLWRILELHVLKKCWFQLPEDGEMSPKHVGVMWKILCIIYGIVHFLVLQQFFTSSLCKE